MRTAAIRAMFYVDERPPWTGPVERRPPESYQRPSAILIARCIRAFCGHWMSEEATKSGRCNICHRTQDD